MKPNIQGTVPAAQFRKLMTAAELSDMLAVTPEADAYTVMVIVSDGLARIFPPLPPGEENTAVALEAPQEATLPPSETPRPEWLARKEWREANPGKEEPEEGWLDRKEWEAKYLNDWGEPQ